MRIVQDLCLHPAGQQRRRKLHPQPHEPAIVVASRGRRARRDGSFTGARSARRRKGLHAVHAQVALDAVAQHDRVARLQRRREHQVHLDHAAVRRRHRQHERRDGRHRWRPRHLLLLPTRRGRRVAAAAERNMSSEVHARERRVRLQRAGCGGKERAKQLPRRRDVRRSALAGARALTNGALLERVQQLVRAVGVHLEQQVRAAAAHCHASHTRPGGSLADVGQHLAAPVAHQVLRLAVVYLDRQTHSWAVERLVRRRRARHHRGGCCDARRHRRRQRVRLGGRVDTAGGRTCLAGSFSVKHSKDLQACNGRRRCDRRRVCRVACSRTRPHTRRAAHGTGAGSLHCRRTDSGGSPAGGTGWFSGHAAALRGTVRRQELLEPAAHWPPGRRNHGRDHQCRSRRRNDHTRSPRVLKTVVAGQQPNSQQVECQVGQLAQHPHCKRQVLHHLAHG
mmetsp:Transcript_6803/g.20949  ORF Transcript_6803/g.20949 Transcript_6803/m.20949 type:complete len:451 (-) Transcript_6803:904-2256(-)